MTTPKELTEDEIEPFREEFSFTKPWRELAEEFRRLSAEAEAESAAWTRMIEEKLGRPSHSASFYDGRTDAFEQAAQIVEDKLG